MTIAKPDLPKPKTIAVSGEPAAKVYFLKYIKYPLLPGIPAKVEGLMPLLDKLAFTYDRASKEDRQAYRMQIIEYMFNKAALGRRIEEPSSDEPGLLAALGSVLSRCRGALPGPFLHIFVLPRFSARSGVNGHAAGDNIFFLYVNFKADWKKRFDLIVAHEYFHLATPLPASRALTLGEHMIDEGLSTLFGEEISGRKDNARPMSADEVRRWLKKLRPRFAEPANARNMREVVSGAADGRKDLGYSLGYAICREALTSLRSGGWPEIARLPYADIFRVGERRIRSIK